MSDKCFVDTNILVYAHDRTTGEKHSRARAILKQLWDSENGALSTQVLQELYVNLRRKVAHPPSPTEIHSLMRDYSTWDVITITPESILDAIEIETRYKTSFWDALIIHAAQRSGADVLYSEDLADGQRYGTVKVINPFTP